MSEFEANAVQNNTQQTEDRLDNYGMLSRLFRLEVDKPLLIELCESPLPEPSNNVVFNEGYGQLRKHLDSIQDIDKGKSELAQDYCYTFLGYGQNDPQSGEDRKDFLAAYPYESVYTTGSKAIGGEHCIEVRTLYNGAGFKPNRDRIAADDHIACELEFMQFLVACEQDALQAADEEKLAQLRSRELEFLQNHLLNWVGQFQEKMAEFARTDFYKGLVRMTFGWLQEDEDYLTAKVNS